ncbi:MAG: ATP-binding protein, partial [Mycobacterium sp.]|uniref:AAA family ATPase n=1 Tax=Mycobacterium sp. TaxID=1785 RepID=UPI003BAFCD3A
MPTGWVAVPPDAVLHRVADALGDTQRSGVVLVGADGVGKTLLARTAAEKFAADKPSTVVRWVVGTATERIVPFGAFDDLQHITDVAETGRPAELLRAAADSLIGDSGELLFVVDDAHQLDHLSATLLYQLALSRSARLIVTVRAGTELPDAVAALSADELLALVEVEPLDRPATAALLESALGATPDPAATEEVFNRSQGNPLYLRHLVQSGDLANDLALPALVDGYLAGLPAPARTVLDYLALAEPLRRGDLTALADQHAVDEAETAGAVASDDQGMVYAAHPLYTDRVRAALPPAAARALRTSLVEQLATRPPDHIGDQLRLSALAVDSDAPKATGDVVAAAQHALRLGELELAEQLARAALDTSDGLAARLSLAYALTWQGHGREAGVVLEAVDPEQLSQSELIEWALPRAANQFWMLSEPERATAFLQTMRKRLSAPTALATLDALAATFAMNAGTPLRALRIANEVLASPHAEG